MLARWLTYLSFICFGILTLTALYIARRPLCIDSKVVERIDRLGVSGTERIYRCAVNHAVPFNTYFNENSRAISQRIGAMERFLENIAPFQGKVAVTLIENRPYLFKVQGHQIFMGQALFETPGHLEKALAKVWYHERGETLFVNQDLLEEVVTDFLVFGAANKLDIRDPITQQSTYLQVKWPYVIKSAQGYCDSPWKFSEHQSLCATQNAVYRPGEESTLLKEAATEYSLRPLLTAAWITAFRRLSFFDQQAFLDHFAEMLTQDHTPALPITPSVTAGETPSPLQQATETVKNLTSFLTSSVLMKESAAYRHFAGNLGKALLIQGFNQSLGEANFDLLFISEKTLSESDPIYQQFVKLAAAQPKKHIALKDPENIWLPPTRYPLPLASFGLLHASRAVVEKCGQFNFNYVLEFEKIADKLLVVDSCTAPKKEIQYSGYLRGDAADFGLQNRGVAFIQFHIPSILMKRQQLAYVPNIYDLIQKHESSDPAMQSLGWQGLRWNQDAQAYRPKAFVDAIEWFRAPTASPSGAGHKAN